MNWLPALPVFVLLGLCAFVFLARLAIATSLVVWVGFTIASILAKKALAAIHASCRSLSVSPKPART